MRQKKRRCPSCLNWVGTILAVALLACGGGGGTSGPVTQAPTITTQPANVSVMEGQNASFTVAASGQPTPTYQWERSADGTTWTAVTGATSAMYTFSAQPTDDGARFRAKATNSAGAATSQVATLTLITLPAITAQPANQTVVAGQQASFTVAADGKPAPSFQWQRSSDGGTTWTDLTAATSATHAFTAQAGDDGARFRAKATNSAGTATSQAATLTVNTVPAVTTQPANQAVVAGQQATFSVQVVGKPVPTLQWQRSSDGGTTWADLTGATSATYAFTAQAADAGIQFRARATNSAGTATSQAATLTVNTIPSITAQPANQTVVAGQQASFTVAADGKPAPSFQWQRSSDGGTTWTDLTGATSAAYAFTTQAGDDGAQFRAKATNSAGAATSQAATLTVNAPPAISAQPANQAVAAGQQAVFTVVVQGNPAPTLQWQRSSDGGTIWADLTGATSATYAFTAQARDRQARFRLRAVNALGSATSNAALLEWRQWLAPGQTHSLLLKADGTVWACGNNESGQLGQDPTFSLGTSNPMGVAGLSGVIAVAGSSSHSLALKVDGTVWAWGSNSHGQLGNGTTSSQSTPIQVSDLTSVVAVAGGHSHSLALKADGTVWAWGYNPYGQLGDGTTTNRSTPVQASGLTGVVAVAGGGSHSLALKADGTVWAWGDNWLGQLGDGTNTDRSTPVQVSGLTGVVAVAGGHYHSLALKADGTVWAWGYNPYGQLGDGTTTDRSTPVQVSGLAGVVAVAGGGYHSLALKADGTVWAWGRNRYGQLGDGTTAFGQFTPVQVSGLTGITALGAGFYHSLALDAQGAIRTWGDDTNGQLGLGRTLFSAQSLPVSALNDLVQVKAGDSHTLALKSDGTVWSWGNNESGQLGDGTTTDRSTPVQMSGLTGAVAVAGGYTHGLALKSDGTVWACGNNADGQLGDGTTTSQSTPVQVSGLAGIVAVAGGTFHSLALKADGTVWAWGSNGYGQLGNGTTTSQSTPVQVSGLTSVVAVAGGGYHNLALKADGTVWAWGANWNGQLGDGTATDQYTPVQVSGLTGVVAVAGGHSHSLALKADGTVWAWGNNWHGQLGDGTTAHQSTPVQVSGLTGVVAVAGGDIHSLAVKADGTVWAWGYNGYGQLGDGTTTSQSTPVQVSGLTGAAAVTGGGNNSLALKADKRVWAWGPNEDGQLGQGDNLRQATPQVIPGFTW